MENRLFPCAFIRRKLEDGLAKFYFQVLTNKQYRVKCFNGFHCLVYFKSSGSVDKHIQTVKGWCISVTKQHIDSKLCQGIQIDKNVYFDQQLS